MTSTANVTSGLEPPGVDDLPAHVHLRVLGDARWRQRQPLGDLLDPIADRTGSMPSTIGAVAAGTSWSLQRRRPHSAAPRHWGQRYRAHPTPPSLSCTVLALTTSSAIPDSRTRLARSRSRRRVGRRELGQRLVHRRRGRPHLLSVVTIQRICSGRLRHGTMVSASWTCGRVQVAVVGENHVLLTMITRGHHIAVSTSPFCMRRRTSHRRT